MIQLLITCLIILLSGLLIKITFSFSVTAFRLAWLILAVLLYFQFTATQPTNYRQLSEMEKISQIQRMHQYPPSAYRLANILEARKEAQIYYKLENNFISIFDLTKTSYPIPTVLILPFFWLGVVFAISRQPKPLLSLILMPLILVTIIGQHGSPGPYSLYPFIISFCLTGFILIFHHITSHA